MVVCVPLGDAEGVSVEDGEAVRDAVVVCVEVAAVDTVWDPVALSVAELDCDGEFEGVWAPLADALGVPVCVGDEDGPHAIFVARSQTPG